MLIVEKRREQPGPTELTLSLPFDLRQKTRLRTTLTNGEEAGLFLPRGTILRDGDCLEAADGRIIGVVAAAEALAEARAADPVLLARIAYHLGNRHAPVEVGSGWVRFAADDVLAAMVRGLGAEVSAVVAPFEPEGGAYGGGHHSHTSEAVHRGVIHEFARSPAPDAWGTRPSQGRVPERAARRLSSAPNGSLMCGDTVSSDTRSADLLALVRVLQLASPALPIGAFSYSQGLERVVEDGVVHDLATAQEWIGDLLELVIAPGEAVIVWRLLVAAAATDAPALSRWNDWFRASRESSELRAETEQMGGSLARLALDLDLLDAFAREALPALQPITLPAAWALVARGMGVAPASALVAYLWAWIENQAMAALKTVPLGQVAGQRLLWALGARIPAVAAVAQATADEDIAGFAPGFAIASSRHETQYTRLFRS